MRQKYSTDLTDGQWTIIAPLFKGMRNRKWDKRELVNAVLYLVDNGYGEICLTIFHLIQQYTVFIGARESADFGTKFYNIWSRRQERKQVKIQILLMPLLILNQ